MRDAAELSIELRGLADESSRLVDCAGRLMGSENYEALVWCSARLVSFSQAISDCCGELRAYAMDRIGCGFGEQVEAEMMELEKAI